MQELFQSFTCGIGVWLNDECILVAGGVAYAVYGYSKYIVLGGGGYNGGKSDFSEEDNNYNGLSYNGKRGTCNTRVAGCGCGASVRNYEAEGPVYQYFSAYGGGGYVADRYSGIAELISGINEVYYEIKAAYAKIIFKG